MGLNLLGIFPVRVIELFVEPLGGNIGFKDKNDLSTIHFSRFRKLTSCSFGNFLPRES